MPKRFRVEIVARAKQDIDENHAYIARDKPKAATNWAKRIFKLIRSLKSNALSHAEIPEAADLGLPYRQFLYGAYRIIYRVDEQLVTVMRVFHAARLFKSRDVQGPL